MNSAFRIIANDEPINRNLVIVVNKNGQVAADKEALQNLLTSKGNANTGVSILRETSPTPSISDEIERERNERIEMKRQEFLREHADEEIDEEELENQMRKITGSMVDEVPHVSLTVESFYPPDQARKFANDILHLGGVDNPQTLMPIDFDFQRQIIQNDHCYTPLTQSPERSEKPQSSGKSSQKSSAKRESKPTAKLRQQQQQVEEESSDSGEAAEEEDDDYGEEQSEDEDEVSYSESDDDNDMDFSVNDRFGKKGKKKRKYRKHKQKVKEGTFKDFLETGEAPPAAFDEDSRKKSKGSPMKKARPSTSGKTSKIVQPKVMKTMIPKTAKEFVPIKTYLKNQKVTPAPAPIQLSVQPSIPVSSTNSKQEIEFVESFMKDLEKSFPQTSTAAVDSNSSDKHIPNIMQIMETNTTAEVLDQSLATLEQLDAIAPEMEDIGKQLIAVLGNEAIDELLNQNDLMNFAPAVQQPVTIPSVIPSSPVVVEPIAAVTSPAPRILNKQAPVKDPIKVVRNGRVITLPPIEAPTTRGAKRRAQGDSPSIGKVAKTDKSDTDSRNSSRRSSLNKSESGKSSRRQSLMQGSDDIDEASNGTMDSEDDPDRLWCICNMPHNNRFMIACDTCEEWYHGKCVNVTKAQGKEFELKGLEWICPNCKIAGKTGGGTKKKQQKLTEFFRKTQKESTDEDVGKTSCVMCNINPARDSSIYCSDECIQKHAIKHADGDKEKESKPKPDSTKRGNVLKDKNGNVIVFEKVTGKILHLSKSPHFTQLGQWLQQNPNYEPVKPGTAQAEQILSKIRVQQQQKQQPQTPTSTTPATPPAKPLQQTQIDDLFSNPVKINTGATPTTSVVKKSAMPQGQHSGNSGSLKSNVSIKNTSSSAAVSSTAKLPSIVASKSPNVTTTKSPSVTSTKSSNVTSSTSSSKSSSKPPLKRQASSEDRSSSSSGSKSDDRSRVRTLLSTTLKKRMEEFDHPTIPKMTEDEIHKFIKEFEAELHSQVKDSFKYKSKCRSFKMNLDDTKNKTILERICSRKLTPKQIVELPSQSLASEELSKWREDEKKHQLEIITKSELDALNQTKILLKSHKGEEIIETKSIKTDILVPVEDDVESVIAKTVLSVDDPHGRYDLSRSISLNTSGGNATSPLSSPSISSSTGRKSDSRHRSRSKSRDRHHHHHHHKSSSSSKHKKSERHRSRSPKHPKSRDKSRDKSREKSRDKSRSKKSEESHKSHHREKSPHHHERSPQHRDKSRDKSKAKPKVEIQPDQQDVDLVGKILDSMGVKLDEKPKEETPAFIPATNLLPVETFTTDPVNEHKLEIEIYCGNMYMIDVADFNVTASIVSGNFDDILKLFPPKLEVIGRIEPHQVWEYLDKVKKIPGREVCILRFASNNAETYFQFFSYLHSRERFGVIKSTSPKIKDFYLVPVEAKRPLPKVLLPIVGPGFIEGEENKPDLLLGVILKMDTKVKKPVVVKKPVHLKTTPSVVIEHPIHVESKKHRSSKLTVGLPEFTKTGELKATSSKSPLDGNDDDDEPYTPFDDEEDFMTPPPNFPATSAASTSTPVIPLPEDLESEMEKINRQIEQRQMEIQTLAQQKAMELDEDEAKRIYEKIQVPDNLSEILSTISAKANETSRPMDEDEDEYVPTPYHGAASYSAMGQSTTIVNSMMDIDERVALFQAAPTQMIPTPMDDQPSRLANMSTADLMKLVPDGELAAPPPPKISGGSIPGIDDEGYRMN